MTGNGTHHQGLRGVVADIGCVLAIIVLCILFAPLCLFMGEPTPEEDYELHKWL